MSWREDELTRIARTLGVELPETDAAQYSDSDEVRMSLRRIEYARSERSKKTKASLACMALVWLATLAILSTVPIDRLPAWFIPVMVIAILVLVIWSLCRSVIDEIRIRRDEPPLGN